MLCLGLTVTLSFSTMVNASGASTYTFSKVKFKTYQSNVILVNKIVNSELFLSLNNTYATGRYVIFQYQGVDSNYQQFSGTVTHNYA